MGSQARKLVEQFRTRNAADVGEGLRRLVEMQATIVDDEYETYTDYASAADKAEVTGDPEDAAEVDPVEIERRRTSLMRNMNSLFTNGSKLYALDRPSQPGVQVNVGVVGASSVRVDPATDAPRTLAAKAMSELEAAGVEPTDEAIQAQIASYTKQAEHDVIEGQWS